MFDLHQSQPIQTAGKPLEEAEAAMVMIHGRGATAGDILSLADELIRPEFAFLAPQAQGNTWYPFSFMEPIERNDPWLTYGLNLIHSLLERINRNGVPTERIMLLGFSQGACLVLEYAARHSQRFGGVVGLSGGLIGPDSTPRDYVGVGSFDGTPVFLGCSDVDPHIPEERVAETQQVFERLGARVEMRLYSNMGHIINRDEIEYIRGMMAALITPRPAQVLTASKQPCL